MTKGFKLIKRSNEYIIELCEGWEKDQFIYKTYEEAIRALEQASSCSVLPYSSKLKELNPFSDINRKNNLKKRRVS